MAYTLPAVRVPTKSVPPPPGRFWSPSAIERASFTLAAKIVTLEARGNLDAVDRGLLRQGGKGEGDQREAGPGGGVRKGHAAVSGGGVDCVTGPGCRGVLRSREQ
jgi:hypothetical protein